jgi:hypothetical protein
MIYQEINFSGFCRAFGIRENNFSDEGKEILFNWLESIGEDVELDVIALCCEYTEDKYENIAKDYRMDIGDLTIEENEAEYIKAVRKYLENRTVILGQTSSGFVFANF